jgi:tetratricopeptide (TPR) repeat protein
MRALCLLGILVSSAFSQSLVGTYRGNDLAGLRGAVEKDSGNHGLVIRLNQALLRREASSAHPDAARARVEEAQKNFLRILSENPTSPMPLRVLCLDAGIRREMDDAIAYGQRYRALVPYDQDVTRLLIRAYFRQGNFSEAAETLWNWISLGPAPSFGALQGQLTSLCLNQEFRLEFEKRLDAGIERSKNDSSFYLYRAILYLETGRTESAWKALHEAEAAGLSDLRTGSRHPFAALLLARVPEFQRSVGSYEGTDLEMLQELTQKHPDHLGLGMRHARIVDLLGNRDQAMALYDKAFAANPTLFVAAYRSGELSLDAGDLDRACRTLDQAAVAAGDRLPASLLAMKAYALAKNGARVADLLLPYASKQEPGPQTMEILEKLGPGLTVVADRIVEELKSTPKQPFLMAHLALVQHLASDPERARASALEAERFGLAGHDGFPAALLYLVHGEALPKEVARALRR